MLCLPYASTPLVVPILALHCTLRSAQIDIELILMPEPKKSLLPPQTVLEVLMPIASMDNSVFEELKRELSSVNPFSDSAEHRVEISSRLKLNIAHLEALFAVLDGLFLRVRELDTPTDELDDLISDYIDRLSKTDDGAERRKPKELETLKSRVSQLFKETLPSIQKAKKTARLKLGFLRNAKQFDTFVDVRPDFADKKYERIDGWVEVVQFRITTDAVAGLERQIVFQCDEASLNELKTRVDEAQTKLRTLKAFMSDKPNT
jgi:hypothetical protein